MAKKPTPLPSRRTPELPWLPPRTPSTWICAKGHINPSATTTCGSC